MTKRLYRRARPHAFLALRGVGSIRLGEWIEEGNRALHVRRRLTETEQIQVGAVVDIRGTPEAAERLAAVEMWLPWGWSE